MRGWGLISLVAVLAFPLIGHANMMHSPWVPQLEQDGQEVVITVAIFAAATEEPLCDAEGTPGIDSSYTLVRTYPYDGGDDEVVFEDRVFTADDALGTEICHSCSWSDPEFCDEDPEGCVDCDGDTVPECPGFCAEAYLFEVIDECVPPASELVDPASVWYEMYEDELGFLGRNGLNVEDAGDDCLDSDADVDADSDGDADSDSDSDLDGDCDGDNFIDDDEPAGDTGDSCSVSHLGSPTPTGTLFFWMAAIGLGALLLTRRNG